MTDFAEEFRGNGRNLLGAIFGLAFGIGCYPPVSSMFLRSLEQEFNWSKTAAAASLAALPVAALVMPLVGRALDRYGVRWPATLSALGLAACLWWLSLMDGSLLAFYAIFLLMNLAGCATGPISYTRTIAAGFVRSRGTALAIALGGVSIMAVAMPPLLAWMLQAYGWRGAYRMMAFIALGGAVAACLCIRDRVPNAQQASQQAGGPPPGPAGTSLGMAMRSRVFWILSLGILLVSTAAFGFVSHLQSIAAERGFAPEVAPRLLSLLALAVFVSRLITGWLLDRLTPEHVAAGSLLLASCGLLLWMNMGTSLPLAMLAVLLLGVSLGAELDFLSFFCARLFGLSHYAQIYGCLYLAFALGIATGAVFVGRLRDITGHYDAAIMATFVLLLAASATFLALRFAGRPRATPAPQPAAT